MNAFGSQDILPTGTSENTMVCPHLWAEGDDDGDDTETCDASFIYYYFLENQTVLLRKQEDQIF